MFSGLANLLFGSSSANNPENISKENENPVTEVPINNNFVKNQEEPNNCDNINLISSETDEDDDWLLVEKEAEEESLPRTDSEEELPFVEIKKSPTFQQRPPTGRSNRRQRNQRQQQQQRLANSNNSRPSSLSPIRDAVTQSLYVVSPIPDIFNPPASMSMEESWFLTPPPCFTSTGPINMELSPFENLLIEHPSMSVYHSIRSAQEAAESFVNLDLGVEESQTNRYPVAERSPVRTVPVVQQQRSGNRIDRFNSAQIKQDILFRNSQKIHDKKDRQTICRGAIKRSNKVRDFNSKGGNRQRRSDMQHCKIISGANNNRKC